MSAMMMKTAARLCGTATLAFAVILLLAGQATAWDGSSSSTAWSGSGTASDPYMVGDAAELKGLADSVNAGTTYSGTHFELSTDIDLEGYQWAPIGGACAIDGTSGVPAGAHFDGVFDGQNHAVTGINVSNPTAGTGAYGLFGYVGSGAVLANFSVAGSVNMGTSSIDEIGAVVGYAQGSLYNVHSSATVYMNDSSYTASMCGGIAGAVESLSDDDCIYVCYCSNTGDVTGRGRMGGIVGAVYCVSDGGVMVNQCCNTGAVTSTLSNSKIYTGGVVGYCRGYISSCYNQGNLSTDNGHYLAGIVGILQGADPVASLSKCYSTAVFDSYDSGWDRWLWASADYSSAVHISNCFWLPNDANSDITQPYDASGSWGTQTFVSSITADELTGSAEMTESNGSGTFSGYVVDSYLGSEDLDNADGAYGFGYSGSGGYPVLGWQLIDGFKVDVSGVLPTPGKSYSVTAAVVSGQGTATLSSASVEPGGSCTVTLTPAGGYWLEGITDNGVDVHESVVSGTTYVISDVQTNHTVQVAFSNGTSTLEYTAGAHGSLSGSVTQTVTDGEDGSPVTAVADHGYSFAGWTDGSSANPRTDTDVQADVAVTAVFLPDDSGVSRAWDHFTIAVLPDTQGYSESYPAIFDQQTQWIADNAKAENIVFVSQLGDLVEVYNDTSQWRNAQDSMAIVRLAGIPYSVVPGNHDLGYYGTPDVSYFDTYFPFSDFTGYSWYGGHSPETSNTSNYELFSAMGQKFVVLNLVCNPTLFSDVTDWANDVLTTYADRKAIVVAHGYIDAEGAFLSSTGSVAGKAVWDDVVKDHGNVIAVLCGHCDGEYDGTSTGESGNTVHNLLTDYQDDAHGGDGWLRLYEFYPLENKVKAVTYSPYLAEYQTDANSQFEFFLRQDIQSVTGVTLDQSAATLSVGDTQQLTATVAPVDATVSHVTWSSSNGAVATVSDEGLVTVTGSGSAVITVTTSDGGKTASCAVTAVSARDAQVSKPAAGAQWRKGTLQMVRFAVTRSFSSGQFGIKLVRGGESALLGTVNAVGGQSVYSFPWRVSGAVADGCSVRIGWRATASDSWITVGEGGAFKILEAQTITVRAPGGDAAWPRATKQTVRWTVSRALGKRARFTVTLRDAAGHINVRKTVKARRGVTSYATKLRLTSSTKVGVSTVRVTSGSLRGVSAEIRVVPQKALRVTAPSRRVTWRRGAQKTVSWALYGKLTWGVFDVRLKSARGKTYALVSGYAPSSYPGRYSTQATMPSGVPTGTGYRLIVRWNGTTSVLSAGGAAITVRK